ncbi:Low molecular weight phosphotyrosine protein phosphatase 1 [Pseudolycoriella hygida]|uniref:Low molecular weight phosphotyrosine protein phosphatase n=1 Tax=Pseudolycoriella hygida TaxID=35572 RepID=A0A9Q0MUM6_9DIPT|nr:Low molecular weight phosphotyrosine protein phosphatase 1 [Pseudolycoriella hygida]
MFMFKVKKVLFVCQGNICQSPIAEVVFKDIVSKRGFSEEFEIDSAAIGSYHVGSEIDSRAQNTLKKHNLYAKKSKKAKQIKDEDFNHYDYIFGMDDENVKALKLKAPKGSSAKIIALGAFHPEHDRIIRDPYYEDDDLFEKCYDQCVKCCSEFLSALKDKDD